MPWYEPARGAPPAPRNGEGSGWDEGRDGRRGVGLGGGPRDEGADVHGNFLADQRDHSAGGPLSGLQHRVEGQLAGMFPLADFESSHSRQGGSFLSRQSAALRPREQTCESSLPASSQNEHPNVKTEDGRVVSKAAHFFHPRPVPALRPYRDFFSPMQLPDEDGGCDQGEKMPAVETNESMDAVPIGRNGVEESMALHDQHLSQQGRAQLDGMLQTPAEQRQERNESRPTSKLKPKDLFEAFKPTKANDPWKRPPKQSTLVQDATTGKMVAEKSNSSQEGDRRKAMTWEQYGGRGPVDNDVRNQGKEKTKEKKKQDGKKKKGKNSTKQSKKSNGGDIGEVLMNGGKKRPSHDVQEDNEGKQAAQKKKQKRDRSLPASGTELEIPPYNDEGDALKPNDCALPRAIPEEDFAGIEHTDIQNAAQCREGLCQFLTLVGRQEHVSFTLLFLDPYTGNYTTSDVNGDGIGGGGGKKKRGKKGSVSGKYALDVGGRGHECTSAFLPTSKSYCTPKGPQCTAWNCTCDDQIRAMRASAALLGGLFVLQSGEDGDNNGESNEGTENGGSESSEWQCFLLPLGPTMESPSNKQAVEYERMSRWPVVPFHGDVSLSDRWSAFEAILLHEGTKLATYNATVSLLPFYRHLSQDVSGRSHCGSPSYDEFAACLAAASSTDEQGQMQPLAAGRNDGYLPSVWDLRLVAWMLRTHASDAELELSKFQEGFPHFVPQDQHPSSFDMSILMQGVVEAKKNLQFIHSLYPIMNRQLVQGHMLDALECIEAPIQSIFASMESNGIGFRPGDIKRFERDLESRIEELESQSRSITKDPDFLLSSPQQVSAYLFDVLKLELPSGLVSKTKAGSAHRSTSEEALKAIQAERRVGNRSSLQIIDIILEFRALNKLLTSFVRTLPKMCRPRKSKKGGRIYPQWMQTSVRTGRFSCRKPNLQQVPNEGALGVHPRDAFAAEEGMCLFACDYSQKEVRIMAHLSQDQALISLFRGDANVDIYKQMSSLIRNKPVEAVSSTERAQFKQVTLALLYGMSPNSVAKKLSISKAQAVQMMNDFFKRFRGVKRWMDETKANARRKAYVKTIAGRKRILDDINSDDNAKRATAERQAINTVVQGSAADLMKSAMVNMTARLSREWLGTDSNGKSTRPRMLVQIHDEVLLEVRWSERDIKRLQKIAFASCCTDCEQYFGLDVPLLLKCSVGRKWGTMEDLDKVVGGEQKGK